MIGAKFNCNLRNLKCKFDNFDGLWAKLYYQRVVRAERSNGT